MKDTWAIAGDDGMRDGYATDADLDSDVDAPERDGWLARQNEAGHAEFAGEMDDIQQRGEARQAEILADFHRKLDAIFGKPAQSRWNNAAQAFGGQGHFPGMKYGERGGAAMIGVKEDWANVLADMMSDLATVGEMVERVGDAGDDLETEQAAVEAAEKELAAVFLDYRHQLDKLIGRAQQLVDDGYKYEDDIAETNRSMPRGKD